MASSVLLFFMRRHAPGGYIARFKHLPNEKARQTYQKIWNTFDER
jgi:hypothetical protein